MSLNCLISGFGETCSGVSDLGTLFASCNVGDCSSPSGGETVGSCISKVDCFNNGGILNGGVCEQGTCFGTTTACNQDNAASVCGAGVDCVPFAVSCHTRSLPATVLGGNSLTCPDPGAAGSSDECKAAHKTPCTILGSGEGMCFSNTPD
jgi:hypothetical protein